MKVGILGHVLLGLLTSGERSGYELTREFDVSLANVWGASHSQIYPELAKLAGAGLIRKTESGPRGSQDYALTEAGEAELRRWLAETSPTAPPRSEEMVRVFFLGMLAPAGAIAYLEDRLREHRATLERYHVFAEHLALDDPELRWHRVALEAGLRTETAMVEWACWAIEEVRARS